jgi:hypothetical protein
MLANVRQALVAIEQMASEVALKMPDATGFSRA